MKFKIHLQYIHEILGKLVVYMCFCLQTCISAVEMAVVIGQSLIVLPFIMYYAPWERTRCARNNFTRALNYAHPYGYKSAISFHSPQGCSVASVAKSWEL